MLIPSDEFLRNPIINPRYIKKNYPEFYEYLLKTYPDLKSIAEQIYWWKHDIETMPLCPSCGTPLKFYSFKNGYATYCSLKCSNSNSSKQEKTKATCLEKYGVENPKMNKKVQEKAKATCLEKYGVENPFASDKIKQKIYDYNLQRYGVKYTGCSDEVKEKIKISLQNKYGVDSPLDLPQTSINREAARRQRLIEKYKDIMDVNEGNYIVKCPHKTCSKCQDRWYEIPPSCFFDRRRDKTEPCTRILPVGSKYGNSGLEKEVQLMLDKHNIEYIENDRSIIAPKELDLFLPKYNIAIECNGIYMHSTLRKEPSYHSNKTKKCRELGIQLIHIWEDWIKNKPEIVESIILSKIGKYNERIYARKCEVREIKYQKSNSFLEKNHIQGKCRSTTKLGLFYRGELVSVMTFGVATAGSGKVIKGQIVLKRFCNKIHTQVVGGASKLLQYYIKHYKPNSIISFSSHDISDGNLYSKLNFEQSDDNQSYWWIKGRSLQRHHRFEFTKLDIVKLGWKEKVDDTWTEEEVMYEHGYYKIIDSGQTKWTLNLTQTS